MTKFRKQKEKKYLVSGFYHFTDKRNMSRNNLTPVATEIKACSNKRAVEKVKNIAQRQANISYFKVQGAALYKPKQKTGLTRADIDSMLSHLARA